ncbi:MAG: ElyC/SanA/YdcF family protein [Gordonia sp. (in: high G+C Gram-positive bacteria)]
MTGNRVRTRRWVRRLVVAPALLVACVVAVSNAWVFLGARGHILTADQLPGNSTALVLGSLVSGGQPGDYVRGRLDTVIGLYRSGRVTRIVNSGNGSAAAGDEPAVMRAYLQARGIPATAILDDPGGFDTDLSCRRLRGIVGEAGRRDAPVVIVTQDFHLPRAVVLCREAGVNAVGVTATYCCSWLTLARNQLREALLARPRALWTVFGGGQPAR